MGYMSSRRVINEEDEFSQYVINLDEIIAQIID